MKKIKVLKATVILFTLLLAVTGVAYADDNTSKFTDIDNSWAKQHIINVYSKGLMGGVTETQFKPLDNVKNYDALVSISRMVNREKDINLEQLEEKYQQSVIEKFKVPEYAKEGILVCLEKRIISDADVSQFAKYPYATKNNIVKYLGMAFGVTVDKDAPPVALGFLDTYEVPTLYKPYVEFLIDKGVISAFSDINSKLFPKSYVDRAAFAKMLDKSNSVYEKEKLGLDTEVADSSSTDTTVPDTNTDSEAAWTDTTVSTPPVIVEDGVQPDVTAYVDQVIPEYGNLVVFVGTEQKVYRVADNSTCVINDVPSGYWNLQKTDTVKLYLSNEKIVKIVAETKTRKVLGKLVSIESADKTMLTIETSSGESKKYIVTSKTVVIKDGKEALWQELKNGNSLVITTSYDELLEINADGVKSTDKGVIESIVYSRMAPPKLVITAPDGSQKPYYVNKSIEITGAGNDIYSLRPGMQIEVSLVDNEIKKIAVINETISVQAELKGIIKSIDTGSQVIVVEVYDSNTNKNADKKIYVTDKTKIVYFNISTLEVNSLAIGSLKVNQTISITGTASADGVFANTIQLVK